MLTLSLQRWILPAAACLLAIFSGESHAQSPADEIRRDGLASYLESVLEKSPYLRSSMTPEKERQSRAEFQSYRKKEPLRLSVKTIRPLDLFQFTFAVADYEERSELIMLTDSPHGEGYATGSIQLRDYPQTVRETIAPLWPMLPDAPKNDALIDALAQALNETFAKKSLEELSTFEKTLLEKARKPPRSLFVSRPPEAFRQAGQIFALTQPQPKVRYISTKAITDTAFVSLFSTATAVGPANILIPYTVFEKAPLILGFEFIIGPQNYPFAADLRKVFPGGLPEEDARRAEALEQAIRRDGVMPYLERAFESPMIKLTSKPELRARLLEKIRPKASTPLEQLEIKTIRPLRDYQFTFAVLRFAKASSFLTVSETRSGEEFSADGVTFDDFPSDVIEEVQPIFSLLPDAPKNEAFTADFIRALNRTFADKNSKALAEFDRNLPKEALAQIDTELTTITAKPEVRYVSTKSVTDTVGLMLFVAETSVGPTVIVVLYRLIENQPVLLGVVLQNGDGVKPYLSELQKAFPGGPP